MGDSLGTNFFVTGTTAALEYEKSYSVVISSALTPASGNLSLSSSIQLTTQGAAFVTGITNERATKEGDKVGYQPIYDNAS
jgi:hypothetical protein